MKQIAIVGLGTVGGSFAKAIHKYMPDLYRVMGIDLNQSVLDKAKKRNLIDQGETVNQTILQQADLVIIALYPTLIRDYVATHRSEFKQGAIITDTAGIKADIMADVLPILPDTVDFIFGHPMAGREGQGFDYSDEKVFQGANYILTPHSGNQPENITKYIQFIKKLGFGRIKRVGPESHDAMIAYTSQLCHLIAVSLINSDDSDLNTAEFIGDSFRELTRIAKMNENMWTELMINNSEPLLKVIEAFEGKMTLMKQAIIDKDATILKEEFIESTKRRTDLENTDAIKAQTKN